MKNTPNWIGWAIGLAITIVGWVYTYATLNARVDAMEEQLKKVNIEVLQMQMKYNRKTLDKIEEKVDRIIQVIME